MIFLSRLTSRIKVTSGKNLIPSRSLPVYSGGHSFSQILDTVKKWNFYSRSNVQKSNEIKVVLLFKRPSHFQWSYQQLIYYLTGALWPVSSKAIQFAQVNNLSAYLSCEARDVYLCGVCPRLRCAVQHCTTERQVVLAWIDRPRLLTERHTRNT